MAAPCWGRAKTCQGEPGKGPQRRLITTDAVKYHFFPPLEDYHHQKEARRRGALVRDFAQLLLRLTTFSQLLLHPFIIK